MDLEKLLTGPLGRIDQRLAGRAYRWLRRLAPVRRRIEAEYESLLTGLEATVKPYRDGYPVRRRLPSAGVDRAELLAELEDLADRERDSWQKGYASGAVYHGRDDHIDFQSRVVELHSQANPLHADLWPSSVKFEAEIVAMTAAMLGGDTPVDPPCGTVTSGGTESILLAMKAYRDRARTERRVRKAEIVAPVTAHVAFDKAAHYFGMKLVKIPVDGSFKADVEAAGRAVTRNTVVLVGSAPSFPHGILDPIEDLSELARARGIGFHTDACLGGFVLPWAARLGCEIPPFDFRLPGVTSMSADTHKYGYAAKGTSVVLYRDKELRRYQYFTATDWPGGLYFSPTVAGSRPGALSAACWAAMLSLGESGYRAATEEILTAAAQIRQGISKIPELAILGDPLWVIAFTSRGLGIYEIMQRMAERGWSLTGLQHPPAVHLAVTLRHTQPGVADRLLADLRESVAEVRADPGAAGGLAPVYGLAATVPARPAVGDLLERYVDLLYEV